MIVEVSGLSTDGGRMNKCFLSLGSNIEPRIKFMKFAISSLYKIKEIQINKISPIYESPAMYYTKQSNFLNMVLSVNTNLNPLKLLKIIKKIESKSGRIITKPNYPRTLDIDILFYQNARMKTKEITIPHPRLSDRKFVLQPWCDIESEFILHDCGKSVKELLKLTTDKSKINKLYDESIFLSYLH